MLKFSPDAKSAKRIADKSKGRLLFEKSNLSLQKTEDLIEKKWLPHIKKAAGAGKYCVFFGAISNDIDLHHAAKILRVLGFSVVADERPSDSMCSGPPSSIYIGWDEVITL